MSERFAVKATAPSNIAFLKYWGKAAESAQWPANDSLSMTLSALRTETIATPSRSRRHEFHLAGERLDPDARHGAKAFRHLSLLAERCGFDEPLAISSHNTFPTGVGIASSASGLAALTIAALAAWTRSLSLDELEAKGFGREHLSNLARLGSGSACRSLWGGFVQWTKGSSPAEQSCEVLAPPSHWPLCDLVVVISSEEKQISSTEAHRAAWSSPFFAPRLQGLPERLERIKAALAAKSLPALGAELEAEALEMHSVIMTAEPSARYLTKETTEFLAWLRRARREGALNAYFTIDAGPNVHLITEPGSAWAVSQTIRCQFPGLRLLEDRTGEGPTLEGCASDLGHDWSH